MYKPPAPRRDASGPRQRLWCRRGGRWAWFPPQEPAPVCELTVGVNQNLPHVFTQKIFLPLLGGWAHREPLPAPQQLPGIHQSGKGPSAAPATNYQVSTRFPRVPDHSAWKQIQGKLCVGISSAKWHSGLSGRRQECQAVHVPGAASQRGSWSREGSPAVQGRGRVHIQTLAAMSRGRRLGVRGWGPSLLLSRVVGKHRA